jgi:hypothetical protein
MDPDGEHVWAVVRCDATAPERFGNECLDSDLDPVLKLNLDGQLVQSFGGGMFIWPHGIHVDRQGNVWVTDAVSPARTPPGDRGHQVVKFSSTGDLLLRLGTPGKPGSGPNSFISPADVVTLPVVHFLPPRRLAIAASSEESCPSACSLARSALILSTVI